MGMCDTLLEPKDKNDDGMILEYKMFDESLDKSLKDTVGRSGFTGLHFEGKKFS